MTHPQTGPAPLLDMQGVSKHFVLHLQNSTDLPVLQDFHLSLLPGECVRLSGPSGMGKSTVLKLAFGNYRATHGHIWVRDSDGTFARRW
jgi:alpha-D-ribose 1-methylphosphonate 5-triphosphate synthase subunit PhnL